MSACFLAPRGAGHLSYVSLLAAARAPEVALSLLDAPRSARDSIIFSDKYGFLDTVAFFWGDFDFSFFFFFLAVQNDNAPRREYILLLYVFFKRFLEN